MTSQSQSKWEKLINAMFVAVLVIAIWLFASLFVHAEGVIEPTTGIEAGHITMQAVELQPARLGLILDPITKFPMTRLTDCGLMPNPASARNNPQAHDRFTTTSQGLYNGYSRFICITRSNQYYMAYDTDGGGYICSMDAKFFYMIKQADGNPVLAEFNEARVDTSGLPGMDDLIWYWGTDGKTYRCQHFLQGPASEKIVFRGKYTHWHSGDPNSSVNNRFLAYAFVYSTTQGSQPVIGVGVIDLWDGTMLPGIRLYNLNLSGVYMQGCSVAPESDSKTNGFLQSQLDFTSFADLQTSTTYPPAKRGALFGGHGGWCWMNGHNVWVWGESGDDYFQYYDLHTDTITPFMKYAETAGGVVSFHWCSILNKNFDGVALMSTYDSSKHPFSNTFKMVELKPINTAIHPIYISSKSSTRYNPSATAQQAASTLYSKSWVPVAQWPRVDRLFHEQNLGSNAQGYFGQNFWSMNYDGNIVIAGGNWNGKDNLEMYKVDIGAEYYRFTHKAVPTATLTPAPSPTPVLTPKPVSGTVVIDLPFSRFIALSAQNATLGKVGYSNKTGLYGFRKDNWSWGINSKTGLPNIQTSMTLVASSFFDGPCVGYVDLKKLSKNLEIKSAYIGLTATAPVEYGNSPDQNEGVPILLITNPKNYDEMWDSTASFWYWSGTLPWSAKDSGQGIYGGGMGRYGNISTVLANKIGYVSFSKGLSYSSDIGPVISQMLHDPASNNGFFFDAGNATGPPFGVQSNPNPKYRCLVGIQPVGSASPPVLHIIGVQ